MQVTFYHRLTASLESVLPRLLEKVYAAGMPTLVKVDAPERIEALNTLLWTYSADSFLPHGAAADGFAAQQPVYLTAGDENPNNAQCLVLVEGASSPLVAQMARTLYLFNGQDEAALAEARAFWRRGQAAGWQLDYRRQTPAGGWEQVRSASHSPK